MEDRDVTPRLDDICLEAPKFILRDFNCCVLDKTLRSYEQYATCTTTQKNTVIDLCCGSVDGAYRSVPMPSLGASYHNNMYLMPVYTPAYRRLDREEKTVKVWTDDSISSLQGCLECKNWQYFYGACCGDINELIDTVLR